MIVRIPSRPEDTICVHRHGWGSRRSCTVERYGSHMIDCSVAKQSLVALSFGEVEFYCIVRAVATSKQTSQILEQIWMQSEVTIASDSSAARGICTRTGSGKVQHLSIKNLWDARIVGHWNESTHVVVAETDATTSWRRAETGVGMSSQVQ